LFGAGDLITLLFMLVIANFYVRFVSNYCASGPSLTC